MRQGLDFQRAIGGRILQQYWLGLQIETYIETAQIDEGFTALDEALVIRHRHGDRFWEADLYRLRGELLLVQQTDNLRGTNKSQTVAIETEAAASFQQAIETARELQAKSLELRATMSLARLWRQQGKRAEARHMLADVYNWFTEGFGTKDLQEAKKLLDALS